VRRLALLALVLVAVGCNGGSDEESAGTTTTTTVVVTTVEQSAAPPPGDPFGRVPQIVERVELSIVAVAVKGSSGTGEGSGVVWDDQGRIVTNNHVIEGADAIEVVLASGARLKARVRDTDQLSDIAVLEVDRNGLPAARFADALPTVGELALAFGNPSGFEQSVTAGIVSGLHRAIPSGGQTPALVDLIQTDAPISPGNSGGALVDAAGQVIGINVAYIPPQTTGAVSLGFAIPAPTAVSVVRQLLETGDVKRAFLGITPIQITPELAQELDLGVESGVGVESVQAGSAADRAGLQGGDVIVAFEGKPISAVEDLFARLRGFKPGDRVTLTIVRDGERRQIEVTLAERPEQ
jgi:serine protease DegQ